MFTQLEPQCSQGEAGGAWSPTRPSVRIRTLSRSTQNALCRDLCGCIERARQTLVSPAHQRFHHQLHPSPMSPRYDFSRLEHFLPVRQSGANEAGVKRSRVTGLLRQRIRRVVTMVFLAAPPVICQHRQFHPHARSARSPRCLVSDIARAAERRRFCRFADTVFCADPRRRAGKPRESPSPLPGGPAASLSSSNCPGLAKPLLRAHPLATSGNWLPFKRVHALPDLMLTVGTQV